MKIDTTKIPNFDSLPTDVKEAITAMSFADMPDMSQFVPKSTFDKKASEAADLSKQLKAKMTEDELAKAQAEADFAAMKARLQELETEKTINENATKFLELGYDSKLAQATAKAMVNGEMDTVFKNHAKFLAEHEKSILSKVLKETPQPPAGDGTKAMTREDLSKMSLDERAKFARENPDKFRELHGGS